MAYWDIEQGAQTPRLLGQVQGTPTIKVRLLAVCWAAAADQRTADGTPDASVDCPRATPPVRQVFKPSRRDPKKKDVVVYQQERKAAAMMSFAVGHMPNFVESVRSEADLSAFEEKAAKYGLPRVLLFSKAGKPTSHLIKAMSTEYRFVPPPTTAH